MEMKNEAEKEKICSVCVCVCVYWHGAFFPDAFPQLPKHFNVKSSVQGEKLSINKSSNVKKRDLHCLDEEFDLTCLFFSFGDTPRHDGLEKLTLASAADLSNKKTKFHQNSLQFNIWD